VHYTHPSSIFGGRAGNLSHPYFVNSFSRIKSNRMISSSDILLSNSASTG